MKRVAVFGSTGAIGRQTLGVIRHLAGEFSVSALVANQNVRELAEQVRNWRPKTAVVADEARLSELKHLLRRSRITLAAGAEAMNQVAADAETDVVVMALAGTGGLDATLKALACGKRVALATKEIMVGYGGIVMAAARRHKAEILPVDSELSAIHQCLASVDNQVSEVNRVILTASGGPFLKAREFSNITVAQALAHPIWRMGSKITVDSATLMNKGLEVIETARFFALRPEQIEVLIHPESIVHSLVELRDGSVLAQLAVPDMRLPIQYALTYPQRRKCLISRIDLARIGRLTFQQPDSRRFPCLVLARQALHAGGSAPCVLNVANEIAVQAFLSQQIRFDQIPQVVSRTLKRLSTVGQTSLAGLRRAERVARGYAEQIVRRLSADKIERE